MNALLPFRRPFLASIMALPGIAVAVAHCGGTTVHTQGFPDQHIGVAASCPSTRPPGVNIDGGSSDGGVPVGCRSDSECTQGKNGRCLPPMHNGVGNLCTYDACFTDDDCGSGQDCFCNSYGNTCLPANCRADSDCGGLGCSPTFGSECGPYGGVVGVYCHTRSDLCVNDGDCATESGPGFCAYSPQTGYWECYHSQCSG